MKRRICTGTFRKPRRRRRASYLSRFIR